MDSETTQSSGMIGLLAWIEVNKKRLVIATAAVIGVVAIAAIVIQQRAQRERNASEALSDVRLPFSPSAPLPPGMAESLAKVADDYKGTKAAQRGLLLSAGVLFEEGKYADAQARFNQVLQQYPDSAWTAEANLGIAASLAALGKTAEATTKYEEIRRRFGNSAIIEETKLALARLYAVPKPEESFKMADEVMKAGGQNSGLAMEAAMLQEDLLKKHPELAKLREPLIAPQVPPNTLTNQALRINATNRPTMVMTTMPNRVATNVKTIMLTNQPSAAPIPLKLSPTPPAATTPPPAPAK